MVLACLILIWFVHGLECVEEHSRGEDMGRACRGENPGGEKRENKSALELHKHIVQPQNVFSAVISLPVQKNINVSGNQSMSNY